MRNARVLLLSCVVGLVGCGGTLPTPMKPQTESISSVIGAAGGYQVRDVSIAVPDLACGARSYSETLDAFLGGFKRAYIQNWNRVLQVERQSVLTGKTVAQKRRQDYLSSHLIKWTKDAEEAMYNYEVKATRVTSSKSPHAGPVSDREDYWRASCVHSAYTKGSTQGRAQAQDDVRSIVAKAPPES